MLRVWLNGVKETGGAQAKKYTAINQLQITAISYGTTKKGDLVLSSGKQEWRHAISAETLALFIPFLESLERDQETINRPPPFARNARR